ncbi:MAG: signal peptidase II [Lachnospiraceae bacterium]|nr:signal peptidase II [Lachnospiraceae bacterium]MBR4992898.1 signal peptidase II [Lachnospiraceae bacterium]
MKKLTLKRSVIAVIAIAILVFLDQLTKYIVKTNFELHETRMLIDGILRFRYIENPGMAWSMLEGKQLLFAIITPIVVFFIGKTFICLPETKRYNAIRILCVLIISGAIGNFIDRVWGGETLFTGGVVDFIDFYIINFPVFNVADIYVTCSEILLIILLIFVYKDEDFKIIISSCTDFKKGDK